jgi:hypothetical protein
VPLGNFSTFVLIFILCIITKYFPNPTYKII